VTVAEEALAHSGALQILLDEEDAGESLTVRLEQGDHLPDPDRVAQLLLTEYPDLAAAVTRDRLVTLHVEQAPAEAFEQTAASGKLLGVVDRRVRNN
jgi:hypothetical protein